MIELHNVSRRFGDTLALSDVSLTIEGASFTSLLGPSGCGKSTLLRIIAGLDQPTSGSVLFSGRDVRDLSAAERNIAMVFQSYALYPHMTVHGNIALPLAMRSMNRFERFPLLSRLLPSARQKAADNDMAVRRIASLLKIEDLLDRKPSQLSGGQKQRAAVGRALVREPTAFLLDEPLSNLDAKLRHAMRAEIVDLHRTTGRTFVYVTHDQAEAMSMSDQVAVIMDGKVQQLDAPRDLYERPATRNVAAFVGDHPVNFLDVAVDGRQLAPPFEGFALDTAVAGRAVTVGIRSERLYPAADGALAGRIERADYLGSSTMVFLRLPSGHRLSAVLHEQDARAAEGEILRLSFAPGRADLFDPDGGQRLDARLVPANAPSRPGLRER